MHSETFKSCANRRCFAHFHFQMCFSLQRRAFPNLNVKKWSVPLSFLTFWLANVFSPQRRAIFRHRNFKKCSEPGVFCTFWFENVLLATAACNFSTSELQKVVRACSVLYILTWKCASRYSGVQFFPIATSKSGPNLRCFVHFDLEMCFSLQRRAIFPHRNFKKWSEPAVFCTFWLGNVLLATAACNFYFSAQQPPPHPPLYRGYFSTQATHKSLKNTGFRDFPSISRLWLFFLLTFAQLYLLSSDSTLLLFSAFSSSDSATLLCFFNCPYCRKLDF